MEIKVDRYFLVQLVFRYISSTLTRMIKVNVVVSFEQTPDLISILVNM